MTKYHISPETGRPNVCKAKIKCPIGADEPHYDTKEAAREGYEQRMKEETIPAGVSKQKDNQFKVKLSTDPEVVAARKMMIATGNSSDFTYHPTASAKKLADRTGMKEDKILEAINEFIKEDKADANNKFMKSQEIAKEIGKNTDPDLSKIKKGSTVVFKLGDGELVAVKVTNHKAGKISGYTDDGDFADSWGANEVLTSASSMFANDVKLSKDSAPKDIRSTDPEVVAARKMMIDTGDSDSFTHRPEASAKKLAERTGMNEGKILDAINEFIAEDKAEAKARWQKSQETARNVAKNTDPDISKIKKGSTVAFKTGDNLVTVEVKAVFRGKVTGYSSSGMYVEDWDAKDILTSNSKLDD